MSKHFQVVVSVQVLSLLVLVLFGQNKLSTGCFLPVYMEEFFLILSASLTSLLTQQQAVVADGFPCRFSCISADTGAIACLVPSQKELFNSLLAILSHTSLTLLLHLCWLLGLGWRGCFLPEPDYWGVEQMLDIAGSSHAPAGTAELVIRWSQLGIKSYTGALLLNGENSDIYRFGGFFRFVLKALILGAPLSGKIFR